MKKIQLNLHPVFDVSEFVLLFICIWEGSSPLVRLHMCFAFFFFNLTKNCPVALCNIGAFSISGSYARPVWVSVRSRNPDNLSAKYLGLKSVRTSLAHSEGAF